MASQERRTSPIIWILRLLVFAIVIFACMFAALLLYGRWQEARLGKVIAMGLVDPNMNPIKRTYLQSYLYSRTDELAAPAGTGVASIAFTITLGENANDISNNLKDAGILNNTALFINYLRYIGVDSKLDAGTFQLSPDLTIPELANLLSEARIQDITLRFLEGWRLEQMVNYLEVTRPANIDAGEFGAIVSGSAGFDTSEYPFLTFLPANASLEGFLYPGSYSISVDADSADLVRQMLARFGGEVPPEMRQIFGAMGMSVYEAVTLASIIERETTVDSERPLMASVFLNRLQQGMLLQADPTVQYALGYNEQTEKWWKSPLGLADLEIDSPYNTYLLPGLPLGPISNPGLSSLQAVAGPETTDYLFFVADCSAGNPGSHVFSTTFEEHLDNVQRCQ